MDNNNKNDKNKRGKQPKVMLWFSLLLVIIIGLGFMQSSKDKVSKEISYNQFLDMVEAGEVKKVVLKSDKIAITLKTEEEIKQSQDGKESDIAENAAKNSLQDLLQRMTK